MISMPDHSRIVVGVAGRIGSGKTLVAQCLERDFGFQYLRYSLVLAEWFHTDPTNKAGLQEVGEGVMAGEGQRELNRRLIARIDHHSEVVVDGLRHPIDYECLAVEFKDRFILIFVECPPAMRFERIRDRFSTYEQFLVADSRPVESNIDSLRSLASATISGTMSGEELRSELGRLLFRFRQRIS